MHTLSKLSAVATLFSVLVMGSGALADSGRRSVGAALSAAQSAPAQPSRGRERATTELRGLGGDMRGTRQEDERSSLRDPRNTRAPEPQTAYRTGSRDNGTRQELRRGRDTDRTHQRHKTR